MIYMHNSTKKISKDRQTSSNYSILQLGNSKSNPIARQILTASWTGGGYGTFRRMYWSGLTLTLWKGNGSTAFMRESGEKTRSHTMVSEYTADLDLSWKPSSARSIRVLKAKVTQTMITHPHILCYTVPSPKSR